MIKVGVVGGTGYTGVELLRLLVSHEQVEVVAVTARSEVGTSVASIFPTLRQHLSLAFSPLETQSLRDCDVVFFATPNGVAMQYAPELLSLGIKVIDLSADFRLRDPIIWEKWYGMPHTCPDLLNSAVYGLPEVNREKIRQASLIANPGCYPTAVQLGFLPLLESGCVNPNNLIADCKSGVSGGGKKVEPGLLYSEAADNLKAYGVAGHRHLPEIQQGLRQIAGVPVHVTFVPHLTPMIRGIHATLYAELVDPVGDLQILYEKRYASEPFVDVLPLGAHPETHSVRGSNYCRIAIHRPVDSNLVVVLAVEDNLVKGAAGQAIQNMNLLFDLPETMGLNYVPIYP